MDDLLRNERDDDSIAIVPIGSDRMEEWHANALPEASAWAGRTGFSASPGSTVIRSSRNALTCRLAASGSFCDGGISEIRWTPRAMYWAAFLGPTL